MALRGEVLIIFLNYGVWWLSEVWAFKVSSTSFERNTIGWPQ